MHICTLQSPLTNADLRHQTSKSATRSSSKPNTSEPLVPQKSSLKNTLAPTTSSLRPALTPSHSDSLIPPDPYTLSSTSQSLNHQLQTPFPIASNHLHLRSMSTANLNIRSPKSSTPSSTDDTNASYNTLSNGLDMKATKKNLLLFEK